MPLHDTEGPVDNDDYTAPAAELDPHYARCTTAYGVLQFGNNTRFSHNEDLLNGNDDTDNNNNIDDDK